MLHLLPPPRHLQPLDGQFSLDLNTCIVLEPGARTLMRTAARQLQEEVQHACGLPLTITIGAARPGDLRLTLTPILLLDYTLDIRADGVSITGRDEAGVLHGVQTLRQIVRQRGWFLPCLHIEDVPAFPFRGFYHDQTRGRVDTLDYLKSLADEMCLYKMNQLQLYVEHTYLFRDVPELWSAAVTPLTSEDILTLDKYCAERGIELVPSLSSFGHLFELLRTKRFSPLCEYGDAADYPSTFHHRMSHHTINPRDERAFPLIASLIDEFLPLFRSDKFNICADETFDLGRGKNQGQNVAEMYISFLRRLSAHVAARGKTPLFWGDIVLKHPEVLHMLPEGAICLNWAYAASVPEDGVRTLSQAGAAQYVCPGVSSWNGWLPDLETGFRNICCMARHGRKYGAIGLLNTDWGDYGHVSDPRFSLPGMVAGACASWGEMPEMEDLWRSLSILAYGDGEGKVIGLVHELSQAQLYDWRNLVDHREMLMGRLKGPVPLKALPEERLVAAESVIERVKQDLKESVPHLAEGQRDMVRRWLTAAEAIRVWNQVQFTVAAEQKDPALAGSLRRFLRQYEVMWREVSRESELHRIREIAVWYAEALE